MFDVHVLIVEKDSSDQLAFAGVEPSPKYSTNALVAILVESLDDFSPTVDHVVFLSVFDV